MAVQTMKLNTCRLRYTRVDDPNREFAESHMREWIMSLANLMPRCICAEQLVWSCDSPRCHPDTPSITRPGTSGIQSGPPTPSALSRARLEGFGETNSGCLRGSHQYTGETALILAPMHLQGYLASCRRIGPRPVKDGYYLPRNAKADFRSTRSFPSPEQLSIAGAAFQDRYAGRKEHDKKNNSWPKQTAS